jgi:general secretion pathway protein A
VTVYIEHFGLREEPFSLAPDPRFLYASEQHREALAHLLYGVRDGGGFVLLTGEIGTGKTTVFRCFLEDVPPEVRLALLLHPRLSSRELLAAVCSEFGIAAREEDGTGRLIEGINRFLIELGASGGRAVIVIDEAQNLSPDILEELRLLTNLETNTRKLLQIVLIGQPELREMLEQPALAQVSQRIVARCHLVPLARREVAPYVRHRLGIAGTEERVFSPAVFSLLFVLTGGVPRLINLVCDRALLGAFAAGVHGLTP